MFRRGEYGIFKVLSPPEHDFSAVEADGLNRKADFALAGFCQRHILDLEHIGFSYFMKANDLWHDRPPVMIEFGPYSQGSKTKLPKMFLFSATSR